MANSEHVEILNRGVEAWNAWRQSQASDGVPDLSKAELVAQEIAGINLAGTNLAGANLRRCNLTKASLDGALLAGAKLQEANLTDASLEGADLAGAFFEDTSSHAPPARLRRARFKDANLPRVSFRGVDLVGQDLRRINLQGASFKDANLLRTRLREADLRDADLSGVKGGLQPDQLAGADLTGAMLPEPLTKLFDELKAVGDISESARKLFIAMLAACLYSWLTIANTTDVNLITNRASSPLPIIQTSIPIVGFYVVAPLLLLCVYFYFHFYLQKLWEELGSLPAVFPDGRRLHERSDPWLLNDLVRAHVAKLKSNRPFMSYFQQAVSVVLAWWLVPITLFLFWGRYLPRHDFYWTTLQIVLLAISITAAVFLYRLAAATLRGDERLPFSWRIGGLKNLRTYSGVATFMATGAVFMVVSVGAIRGIRNQRADWWLKNPSHWSRRYTWVPRGMWLVRYAPFADLRQADVSVKPPNWTGKDEKELDLVKSADLHGLDLRYADIFGAFLAKANLEGAWLEGAWIVSSDLRGAYLLRAHVARAHLARADLAGADLGEADLANAILTGAHLAGADLGWAHLAGAYLGGADLTRADLDGADLTNARLPHANLTEASLWGTDLRGTDLSWAHLADADLKFADFRQTRGITKELTADQLTAARNWEQAYYDDDLLKALRLPPDHNTRLAQEQRRLEQGHGRPTNAPGAAAQQSPLGSEKPAKPKPARR